MAWRRQRCHQRCHQRCPQRCHQRCHLCQLPKPPWAVLGDFGHAVCRACVNFEGATRVELLLAAMRGHCQATMVSPSATVLSPSVTMNLDCVTFEGTERCRDATMLALSSSVTAVSPSVPTELGCVTFEGTERHLWGHHDATLAMSPNATTELGCVTFEGTDRRRDATLAMSPSVPMELGCVTFEGTECHYDATLALSPDVPTELREASCGRATSERRLRRRHRDVTSREMSPSAPTEPSEAFCSRVTFEGADATLALSPSVPTELSDPRGRISERRRRHHRHRVPVPPAVSPSVPAGLSQASCHRVTLEAATERRHRRDATALPVSPTVPTELTGALLRHRDATLAVSPPVPEALRRHRDATSVGVSPAVPAMSPAVPAVSPVVPAALSAALRLAWPGKPRAVRERLSVLAGCAPFAVRFRKDHALVGRVLAFDAAPRHGPGAPGSPGGDFELRLFAEYPCGSGSVYGALGLARRMFQDCPGAPAKSISSGYKYLEYEKRQGSGEWRLLAELFTEPVRLFRRPPSPEALPQRPPCRRRLPPMSPISPPLSRRKSAPEARLVSGQALSCGRCRRLLEDTHFVQCPAVARHRFCFPCARRAIGARRGGGAVHCPSGRRCPLSGNGPPWAFLQGEIAAILAGEVRVKRERDP